MALFVFALLLVLLFFLSQRVTRLLSHLFMTIFRNTTTTVYLLSFLFLPGVVLHELSHLLVANLLLVPTGEVEFFPEIQGHEVKMGSVAVAKTDPLRRFLIGLAPIIGGIGVIAVASGFLGSSLLFYCIFQIANTMFSSKKDMEGALELVAGVLILGVVLQLLGIPTWEWIQKSVTSAFVVALVWRINAFLFLATVLDIFLVLLFEGTVRIMGAMSRRRS